MFSMGLGVGQLIAASFIWKENPLSPSLPALTTFGLGFIGNAAWKWWQAGKLT